MKIEFDLPEFEKEINVSIIIRKDGEVVCNTTATSSSPIKDPVKKEQKRVVAKKVEEKEDKKPSGGNFMNMDF